MKYLKLILITGLLLWTCSAFANSSVTTQSTVLFNESMPTTNTTYIQTTNPCDAPIGDSLQYGACFSMTGTFVTSTINYEWSGDCINWTSPIEAASITSAGYYCSGVSPFNTITSTTVNLPYIRFMLTTATATTSDLYVKGRFYKK